MASNDYYHDTRNQHTDYDNYDNYDRRQDAPLPALPPQQPSSPLDDRPYPYQNYEQPDTAYRGNTYPQSQTPGSMFHGNTYQGNYASRHSPVDERDPFGDHDAVPMDNYKYKHSSQSSTVPVITPVYDDPFVRDVDPNSNKRRWPRGARASGGKKNGWFSGQITWVCYILTLIQIIVFIVEIIKNGNTLILLVFTGVTH